MHTLRCLYDEAYLEQVILSHQPGNSRCCPVTVAVKSLCSSLLSKTNSHAGDGHACLFWHNFGRSHIPENIKSTLTHNQKVRKRLLKRYHTYCITFKRIVASATKFMTALTAFKMHTTSSGEIVTESTFGTS